LFDSLDEVQAITAEWLEPYKEVRPHDAPGSVP
jgi:transposase InsO family protein